MAELLEALGINAGALIIQVINFGILLTVLTLFVYRPLARMMEERRRKIELGVRGGEEAAKRIEEAEQVKQHTIREGERQAVVAIAAAEADATRRSREIVHGAEKKAEYVIEEALAVAARKKEEELAHLRQEAHALIKQALVKTVELDPSEIDEKLITKALNESR